MRITKHYTIKTFGSQDRENIRMKNNKNTNVLFYLMGNFWLVEDEDKEESSITESSLFIDLEKKQLIGEIR